jgi:hypothetical protein
MLKTRTRNHRPETPAWPDVERRAETAPIRRTGLLDLESQLPWIGPAPHWVCDLDGARLRTSLEARGFTVVSFGHNGPTTEEALLAELQCALGLPVEARTSWASLCDTMHSLIDLVNTPIALIWMNAGRTFSPDLAAGLRTFVALTTAIERWNERHPDFQQIALVLQGDRWGVSTS